MRERAFPHVSVVSYLPLLRSRRDTRRSACDETHRVRRCHPPVTHARRDDPEARWTAPQKSAPRAAKALHTKAPAAADRLRVVSPQRGPWNDANTRTVRVCEPTVEKAGIPCEADDSVAAIGQPTHMQFVLVCVGGKAVGGVV